MKRVRITDPVECKVELHLLVKNSKFPRAVLEAAHASIILLDATKNGKDNLGIMDQLLKTLEREKTGC